mmetsp:Transcript_84023/g.271619  ORF Transcript_84023/g.271619 Transcript_84023/m.271619 type:complete len:80 (+) Transcript_84023:870-1109(+)
MGAMTTTSVHVHGWDLIFLTAALLMARVFKPDLLWWAAVVNRGLTLLVWKFLGKVGMAERLETSSIELLMRGKSGKRSC